MWIFTDSGFISAVRKTDRPDLLTIRARDEQSLLPLAQLTNQPVAHSPRGDYPYRIFVTNTDLANWLSGQVMTLEYDNFKNRVYKTRGRKFVDALHNVWSVMHQVELLEARLEKGN